MNLNNDDRHVYAARCAWSGPITAVGSLPRRAESKFPGGLPCCPHCKSVLFEMPEDQWWQTAQAHEAEGATNYVEFLKWKEAQKKCFQTPELAAEAFTRETGKPVKLNL